MDRSEPVLGRTKEAERGYGKARKATRSPRAGADPHPLPFTLRKGERIWAYLNDRLIAVFLALLVVATRWPFRSRVLYNWDSANFALALRRFDVTRHFPQPPGYFSYVQLGGLVDALVHDANASFVLESVLFSALAVMALYYLGKVMFDRATGITAALLLVFSVTFWSYGTIALPYVALAFFSTAVAALAYGLIFAGSVPFRKGAGISKRLLALSLVYTIGGGFRPDLLLFLAPLWLLCLWLSARRAASWSERLRVVGISVLIVGAGFAAWFVPTVWLSGGLASYSATFAAYTSVDVLDRYAVPQNGLAALVVNIRDTASYLFFGLYATAGLLALGMAAWASALIAYNSERRRPSAPRRRGESTPRASYSKPITDSEFTLEPSEGSPPSRASQPTPQNNIDKRRWLTPRVVFLLGWLAPMALFYIWIHIGDPGYVFTMLPALLIVAARGALASSDLLVCRWSSLREGEGEGQRQFGGFLTRDRLRTGTAALLVGIVLVANVTVAFVHVRPLTLPGMARADRSTASRMAYIRENYAPGSVVLISYDLYRHLMYYLPEYDSVWLDVYGRADSEKILAPGVRQIVLVDDRLGRLAPDASPVAVAEGQMYVLPVKEGKRLVYGSAKIALR